jgi:hypothetical protein
VHTVAFLKRFASSKAFGVKWLRTINKKGEVLKNE